MRLSLSWILLAYALPFAGCSADAVRKDDQDSKMSETKTNNSSTDIAKNGGKPSAPVEISGTMQQSSASVTVRFSSDANNVTIKVWGVDGLELKSPGVPVSGKSYASGDVEAFDVSYSAPENRCDLAVAVAGTFAGRERSKVQSFEVNPNGKVVEKKLGESRVDSDGRPVQVMKAGE